MDFTIRSISQGESSLLEDFLYEAIFIPPGVSKPPRSIINRSELKEYIVGFGEKKDDMGLVAEIDGRPIGAVWTRIMNDYGHIDNDTPSFALSIKEAYRNLGVGSELMKEMLRLLKDKGYEKASLSVQKANYAFKMYLKLGFKVVFENEDEYIMLYDFNQKS